jgi:hypothetical protein
MMSSCSVENPDSSSGAKIGMLSSVELVDDCPTLQSCEISTTAHPKGLRMVRMPVSETSVMLVLDGPAAGYPVELDERRSRDVVEGKTGETKDADP